MKSIHRLSSYWFFPVFFAVTGACLILQNNLFIGGVWLYSLIRLLCTRKRLLIMVGFLCLFFTSFLSFAVLAAEQSEQEITKEIHQSHLRIYPDSIKVEGDSLQVEGQLFSGGLKQRIQGFYRLTSDKEKAYWSSVQNGVIVSLSGSLEVPSTQRNLNGFDFQKLLRSRRISRILNIEQMNSIREEQLSFYQLVAQLSVWRRKALLYCREHLSAETGAYTQMLLLGDKTDDLDMTETFKRLGLLHLFSLSGMHVAFFAKIFRYCMLRVGVTLEHFFWLQLLASFLFAGITGFSISTVRALLQKNLSEANRYGSWQMSPLDIWSLTVLGAFFLNPFTLFTMGGQYSYFLSFFILYISSVVSVVSGRLNQQILFSVLLGLSTIPLSGLWGFEWQPLGIVLTFLLVPIFEKLLLPGLTMNLLLTVTVSHLLPDQLMKIIIILMNKALLFFEGGPIFSVVIGRIPLFLFIIELVLLFVIIERLRQKSLKVFIFIGLLLLLLNQTYFFQGGIVAFIDVGQGDSIFLQAPFNQEAILIDTDGKLAFKTEEWRSRKVKSNAQYTVIPFLKSRGVQRLDKVFISHSDVDHMGDLLEISEAVGIKAVYFAAGGEQDAVFLDMLRVLNRRGTQCYSITAGEVFKHYFGFHILAPETAGRGGNEDSLVIYSKVKNHSFLYTGDLEAQGEKLLVEAYPLLTVDILKVGHHGSKTSTSKEFLDSLKPETAVISCGRENRFGHPHEEVLVPLKKKADVYRTDQQGMIYYEWFPFGALSTAQTVVSSEANQEGAPKK